MTFNHPTYLNEFRDLIARLKGNGEISTALEVGCYSGELTRVLGETFKIKTTGISLVSVDPDVIVGDYLEYEFNTKFDLVFSSGVLEHYDDVSILKFLKKMKNESNRYVLNVVPNEKCRSYKRAIDLGFLPYERSFTIATLSLLYVQAGFKSLESGYIGYGWAKSFKLTEKESYLVYVVGRVDENQS